MESTIYLLLIISFCLLCETSHHLCMGCKYEEREALLNFKNSLFDEHNLLPSWTGRNCCKWRGVGCTNTTGHVIELSIGIFTQNYYDYCPISSSHFDHSLLRLKFLQYLDLSNVCFNGISIPESIGSLTTLQHLDLSNTNFSGSIPPQLGNLTNLQYLDLGYSNLFSDSLKWLSHLSSLQFLDLNWLNLTNAVDWPIVFYKLPALSELHLSHCGLLNSHYDESAPHTNLSSITTLVLSGNDFVDSIQLDRLLHNLNSSLVHLDLSYCEMNGSIPKSLGRLTQLEMLDLSRNSLQGSIPSSLFNMCNLHSLVLSNNELAGNLSSMGEGQATCKRYSLKELDLSYNQLTGNLSDWIGQMRNLEILYLSYNNHLVFNLSSTWVPPFQLKNIGLASCQLGSQFPSWLQTQRSISSLDISDAGISDVVPFWFWKASSGADYVNISNNQIKGEIPISLNFLRATLIDLSSNQLRGQLPYLNTSVREIYLDGNSFSGGLQPILNKGMRDLSIVLLSQNHLSGQIPSAICNLGELAVIDISLNNLSGQIPKCHINPNPSLSVVNLASNHIHGSIPQWMASEELQVLRLDNNSIQGEISSFLRSCTSMEILDLAENRLTGNIPSWIGESLTNLLYLRLRSNMLTGTIPPQLSYLTNLQVLDLAQNNLSGSIPHSFDNFTSMAKLNRTLETRVEFFGVNGDRGFDGLVEKIFIDLVKGREVVYTNTASLVMILDLSCNGLFGEIPIEIMKLFGLQSLNLSGNQLVGEIPDNFDGMVQLEALDLSRNHLSGAIPKSMTLLTSLNTLNLSYNNLSGEIPSGNQLRTLTDPSIYAGNSDLCGFPLQKCHCKKAPMPAVVTANRIDNSNLFELYLSMGVGYAVGLWGFCGIFVYVDSWRIAYFRFFDDMADKFFCGKADEGGSCLSFKAENRDINASVEWLVTVLT